MLETLIHLGLPKKEAQIYLALLELGPSSVTQISKRAKVPRTNAYHLLNSLVSQGLVSSQEADSKMVFAAADPKILTKMLKDKRDEYERLCREADKFIPELQSVYNKGDNKMKVRFFEGVEGVISVYEDTLNSKSEILAFASVENQHAFFPGYFPAYYTRRAKKGIPVRCFAADSEESRRIQKMDEVHLRRTYIVPSKFEISPEINIYDDKVAIFSLSEKFGAIIESPEVANAFRKMFELADERASEYDKDFKKS